MLDAIETSCRIQAALNFAADRSNGGIWSNYDRSLTTQRLQPEQVEIRDARDLPTPATLAREGFQLLRHKLPTAPNWTDQDWIDQVYLPDAMELVRTVTGADHVELVFGGALIRDSGNTSRPAAAEFVHLDQTVASALPFIEMVSAAATRAAFPRVKIFNVWRPITPPPQDVPLALCDKRTVDRADWVLGLTVEPSYPQGAPYITSVYNPAQRWYFISDVTLDDAILFQGLDTDETAPMGCMHGAFRHPEPPPGAIPRASIEMRVFAFFKE